MDFVTTSAVAPEFACLWKGCGFVLDSFPDLVAHIQCLHVDSLPWDSRSQHPRLFVCRWRGCTNSQPFAWHLRMTEHVRLHTGERPFMCPVLSCGQSFNLRTSCTTHIHEFHVDSKNLRPAVLTPGSTQNEATESESKAAAALGRHLIVSDISTPAQSYPWKSKYSDGEMAHHRFDEMNIDHELDRIARARQALLAETKNCCRIPQIVAVGSTCDEKKRKRTTSPDRHHFHEHDGSVSKLSERLRTMDALLKRRRRQYTINLDRLKTEMVKVSMKQPQFLKWMECSNEEVEEWKKKSDKFVLRTESLKTRLEAAVGLAESKLLLPTTELIDALKGNHQKRSRIYDRPEQPTSTDPHSFRLTTPPPGGDDEISEKPDYSQTLPTPESSPSGSSSRSSAVEVVLPKSRRIAIRYSEDTNATEVGGPPPTAKRKSGRMATRSVLRANS
ncbi:hypothetical protein BJ742DRAFT_375410 [Cladochytrium replicatum]|nr:hypothetical protein BJ742DRAFT_375410 [Cladochytrium replicatum]